jgi:hypothetical protein
MVAFRLSPVSFARFIGEPLNAARNASALMARISVANVRPSLSAIAGLGWNFGSFTSRANFTFQGQTFWEVCRQNCIAIPLATGGRTYHGGSA